MDYRKRGFLYNGLSTTAQTLLNQFKESHISVEEYIKETRMLFDMFENMVGEHNDIHTTES